MGTFYGKYRGLDNWKPNLIPTSTGGTACKLWLDGSNLFDLTDNLISYWKLDETSGTVAIDSHGNYDGTLAGTTLPATVGTGIINRCYAFNGVNGIDCGDAGSTLTNNFTISCWVQRSISSISRRMVCRFGHFEIGEDASGFLVFDDGITEYDSGYDFETSGASIWRHVVVVINGANSRFYVDGVQEGSTFNPSISTNINNTIIGARTVGAGGWRGLIDEVALWNRALAEGEVQALYNSGLALAYPLTNAGFSGNTVSVWSDRSGNNNHFTQPTTAAQPTYTLSASTLTFDGVGEFLSLTDFTNDIRTAKTIVVLASYGSFSEFTIQSFNGATRYGAGGYGFNLAQLQVSASALRSTNSGTNQLVLFQQDGTGQRVWINNVEDSWASGTPNSENLFKNTATEVRLKRNYATGYSGGIIKEIIIYNRVLTNKERTMVFRYLNNKYNVY